MDAAEVLSIIVERACAYVPEVSAGARNVKRPKALTEFEIVPKEALTEFEKVPKALSNVESPKEAFSEVEKVSMVASDLVRFN